ncbi:MAG: glycosyltransferase family 2 protein [Methanothrix sp.]|jgi:hypothetical protein|nr:glycosyltransferase family 2 protein [Methanothrix sp.]
MASFLTVNYKSTFFANSLIASIPKKWRDENEIVIIDNSKDLELDYDNVKVVHGIEQSHSYGLERGLKECSNNTVIISDIDCILLDPQLLNILTKFIEDGGAMMQCQGSPFKPFHPCFGVLNKEIFMSEKLSFHSKEQINVPDDWEKFFGKSDFINQKQKVYLDVGVDSAYQLLRRGYKVSVIPNSLSPDSFKKLPKSDGINGWWFGFGKPQVWHVVYGASSQRFIRNEYGINIWEEKKKLVKWVFENLL